MTDDYQIRAVCQKAGEAVFSWRLRTLDNPFAY